MLYVFALIVLPPLLVFGLYHLNLWLDIPGIGKRPLWARVAVASGEGHLLIVLGLFWLAWLDYRAEILGSGGDQAFGVYLLTATDFPSVMWVLDPFAMVILFALIPIIAGFALGATVMTLMIAGTMQWMLLGGAAAWGFARVWGSLRTEGDDLPNWF
jgi:hypothetical protein